jgi:hypothetical protein
LIDADVRGRALEKFRRLIKGNGIRPETVEIADVKAQTLSFTAQGFVRLTTHYTSHSVPGKIDKGEAIGSTAAFEAALRGATIAVQRESAKRKIVTDAVLARPDKGYGAREQVMKLDALSRDFVSHDGCTVCQQTGQSACGTCGGKGIAACPNCGGRQSTICPKCKGNGTVNLNGRYQTCTTCRGRTRVQCHMCQGRGTAQCRTCRGAGKGPCSVCKASGVISHLAKVELIGHLHFTYDRQGLPVELTKLLDVFYPRYIERKDIDLKVLTYDWDENEPAETIPIGYEVKVPYGEITFKIGKKRMATFVMMGMNGDLIKGPHFLDDITRAGQAELAEAAKGAGNVGQSLRVAARYRMLREAIMAAASAENPRKALSLLTKKYPVGISSDKLLLFINQAGAAMHVITRKPRLIGLGIGAAIVAAINAAYFITARPFLTEAFKNLPLQPEFALAGSDMSVVLLGGFAATIAAQIYAGRALKTALTGLASPKTIKGIMPKIGWTLWAGMGIAAVITALFYFQFMMR